MRPRRFDVAIHAPLAGPLYDEGCGRTTGGAELQMWFLAHALTDAGLRVCHILFADADLPEEHGGVSLVFEPVRSHLVNRLESTRRIVNTLRKADAAIYIQRSAGYDTGVVGLFARSTRRRFVFSSSSSADMTGKSVQGRITPPVYRVGLRCADAIVVQTAEQLRLGDDRMPRTPRVIPSFSAGAPDTPRSREYFLWIGGVIGYKGPLEFVELAQAVPEARFVMVASDRGADHVQLASQVRRRAADLPNLELWPPRSRGEVLKLYEGAVAVVNTSEFEGMPNTFLEGWARGVPSLSLRVDPDHVISGRGLGLVADGSLERMAAAAREMWSARSLADNRGESARAYVAATHDPGVVGGRWLELLAPMLPR